MNKKQIWALLLSTLGSYDLHAKLGKELLEIIAGSGYEAAFFRLLAVRLSFLSKAGIQAVEHKEFELLGHGVYSMHLSSRGFNIRILYSFLPDGRPSLLTCFYERAGKDKTDYSNKIELAKDRFEERLEAYSHENAKQ